MFVPQLLNTPGPRNIIRRALLFPADGSTPTVVGIRPTVCSRGLPGIGACVNLSSGANDYRVFATLSFDADETESWFDLDHELLGEFIEHCGPINMSVEQFINLLPDVLCSAMFVFDDQTDDDAEDVIRWQLTSSLSDGINYLDHDFFVNMPATVLRDICNAVGAKPASIKKNDCIDALAARRKEFEDNLGDLGLETHPVFESVKIAPQASIPGPNYGVARFALIDGVGEIVNDEEAEEWLSKWSPRFLYQHFPMKNFRNGGEYKDAVVAKAKAKIEQLRASTLVSGVGAIAAGISLQEHNANAYYQQTQTLQHELTQLNALCQRNEQKIKQLISSVKATTPIELPEAAGEVEVMGKMLPFYASPDAPDGIPNYSLEFWSAKQRLGPGAESVRFDALDFINAALNDIVVSQVGPPGTGKTTIVRQAAHVLGLPCHIVQFTRDKPIESLIGVDKIQGGQQVFVDGEITLALRRAASNPDVPVLVCFDEFDHAPAEIQSDFHGVVEGRDYVLPSGEVIKNHGNLRFILTRNTSGHGDQSGRHSAANVSDSAFNSRIKSAFNVDYMDPSDEQVLLATMGLDMDEAETVVKFANSTRDSVAKLDSGESYDGMTEPVCLRHLLSYTATRARGVSRNKALAQCIVSQLPERDRSVANEMIVTHFKF